MSTQTSTINLIRNPYEDGKLAAQEADLAISILTNHFNEVKRVGRKRLYLVDDTFYVYIVSAPSSLRLDTSISDITRTYGKKPFYILFTRDVSTYPLVSFKTYNSKIKKIYKIKRASFMGCVLGLNELNADIIMKMMKTQKIEYDFGRYAVLDANYSIDDALKACGLSSSKIELAKSYIKFLSVDTV